jgi:hypothetical protein
MIALHMPDEQSDDIAETLVEGDSYEQAALAVSRMVPLSLDTKIRIAIGLLALSGAIAPAVLLRRDLVRSLEGTGSLSLTLGLLVLNGIITITLAGLLLVRQRYILTRRSLSSREARKLVRLEDFLVLFVLLGGLFVVAPLLLAVVGLVSPSTVETFYANDINIYQPDETLGIDLRAISAAGGFLAIVLFGLWRLVR